MKGNAGRFSYLFIMCAAWLCTAGPVAADTVSVQPSLCVLPVKTVGVADNEALLIGAELTRKLSQNERLVVADKNKTAQALKDAKLDAGGECASAECVCSAGEKCQSSFALSSSIGKVGTLFTYSVALYNVKDKKRVLLRDYQFKGQIEDFYTEVPRRIADDILALIVPLSKPAEAPLVVSRPPVHETPVVIDTTGQPVQDRPVEKQNEAEKPFYNGIAAGPSIGIAARAVLGKVKSDQSQWGASLWYAHPTSRNSQVRIKFGMPLSGNDSVNKSVNLKYPDLYLSLEHEWGFKYFGVGVGLAVMQMQAFTMMEPYSQFWDAVLGRYVTDYNPVHFSEQYCVNWVVTIRAGKPNMGFRGKISWPTPVNQDMSWIENAFFEYSAFGVFGSEQIKGGIGIMGMQKYRSSVEIQGAYSESHYTLNNSFAMIPCGKFGMLIGNHSVLCAALDLAGILFPRWDTQSSWAPLFQLSYTFSFAPLKGADVLDGTF
jgi:hypothetical protein